MIKCSVVFLSLSLSCVVPARFQSNNESLGVCFLSLVLGEWERGELVEVRITVCCVHEYNISLYR